MTATFTLMLFFTAGAPEKASAQQANRDVPQLGAPDATYSPNSKVLPVPELKFGGVIKYNAVESKPWWPPRVAPQGRSEYLVDNDRRCRFRCAKHVRRCHPDAGAGSYRCRRTALHQLSLTALCSPTRAALITGRNHHSVGFGVISEAASGFPGYDSIIGKDTATIGRILLDNGYRTSWFGKDHNTPTWFASQAGPFEARLDAIHRRGCRQPGQG